MIYKNIQKSFRTFGMTNKGCERIIIAISHYLLMVIYHSPLTVSLIQFKFGNKKKHWVSKSSASIISHSLIEAFGIVIFYSNWGIAFPVRGNKLHSTNTNGQATEKKVWITSLQTPPWAQIQSHKVSRKYKQGEHFYLNRKQGRLVMDLWTNNGQHIGNEHYS